MKIVLQNVLWLLVFVAYQYFCLANESATIGVIFSEEINQSAVVLKSTIHKKNTFDHIVYFRTNVKQVSKYDSFEASKTLCKILAEDDGVAAVISLNSPTIALLESICAQFEVPFFMTSWKAPTTRQVETVFNFFPKAELFSQALAEVVRSLQWSSFVIVYEHEEGLVRMQDILKLQDISHDSKHNNIRVKQLGPGDDHRSLLKEIKNASETNIILDCETEHIIPILKQAKDQNLLNINNNYFLTSLDAHTLNYTELRTAANITTIRLFNYNTEDFNNILERWKLLNSYDKMISLEGHQIRTETVLFHDALLHLTTSINELLKTEKSIRSNSINCFGSTTSRNGYTFASYMKERKPLLTLSGPIEFDNYGNRIDFNIHVVDVIENQILADWYASNSSLVLRRNSNEREFAAVTNLQKIVVNVTSRLGDPYLMKKTPEEGKTLYGNDRYEGYSMDLIQEIANIIGFRFEFHLTKDGQYGKWDESQKRWTGLVGDLLEGRAQLAICDLTITHQRREAVDFSTPFMSLGISILYKEEAEEDINMFAFLDPFSMPIWIYTATLYLVISVVLYFISRMTPGDWENPHPCNENPEELENIWSIKNCLWLTLGSIMTQGCDILPKGISSRMAVSMWWFFSLIVTSSYTANLAAFLTKDRMESSIKGAEDLAKQTKIKYGVVDGGSTMSFFKDSNVSTYKRMWINMESTRPSVFEKHNNDGVKRVQSQKGNYAFLMESTQIEYEIETKCDLKQVGGSLDSKSFGIAMPMNSGYRTAINKAILKLQENGKLKELKETWWKKKRKEPSCETVEAKDTTNSPELALANVGGVFFVLGIGIAIAVTVAICEFLWNVRSVSVDEHLTYWEALKVEFKFACNVWITKKRIKPVIAESSSAGSNKNDNKSMIHSIFQSAGSLLNLNN
ncbi:glutamate receptor ionotropic, kainate 2-like [Anoplophora glabripennis]|uniref:glutamate receptor ionotropic, kainate 2-like n=1 Tax=Anoplophora glabripennis TaxID=217634 RepID=UPI0008738F63|nr:glutamate receptor ionotropic, kainate 2-like [Anoplophora glabripennis]